jgi:hypothetical protein
MRLYKSKKVPISYYVIITFVVRIEGSALKGFGAHKINPYVGKNIEK